MLFIEEMLALETILFVAGESVEVFTVAGGAENMSINYKLIFSQIHWFINSRDSPCGKD